MEITAVVERIISRKPNMWTALAVRDVKPAGTGVRFVSGIMPPPRVGMTVACSGEITQGKFGIGFKADSIAEHLPTDTVGIENYLASGLIHSIGPVLAHLIVETFGEDTLDVLDNHPERLKEIRGIGRKRIEAITEALKDQQAVRQIMIWLKRYGITNNMAAKIYTKYGDDSVSALTKNPYRLSDDIKGVAFKKADDIARSIGLQEDSPYRIMAGIKACLEDAAAQHGHTYLPIENLVKTAAGERYLNIDTDVVRNTLQTEAAADSDGLVITPDGCVFLRPYYDAEKRIAARVASIASADCEDLSVRVSFSSLKEKTGLTYSENQKKAILGALSSGFSIITGGPGTGKTSVSNAIISEFTSQDLDVLLAAPTGRAAKRMQAVSHHHAQTIHSLLGSGPDGFARNADSPLHGDVLIVDECSMIDARLAASLLSAVPDGMRVCLIGDDDQLPSIGAGRVLKDLIASETVPCFQLTDIFRQAATSEIVTNAHKINKGQMISPRNDPNGDMFFIRSDNPADISEKIIKMVSDRIPKKYGIRPEDIQVLSPRRDPRPLKNVTSIDTQAELEAESRRQIGTCELNRGIQAAVNPSGKVLAYSNDNEIRTGDRIMQKHNDYDKGVFNGDIGTVIRAADPNEDGDAVLVASFDGKEVRYRPGEINDIELAYACTVHKSQGMEYPAVIIPIHRAHSFMLKRNLLYTAVTRAKRLCVLVGMPDALGLAIHNEDTSKRKTKLVEYIGEAMHQAKREKEHPDILHTVSLLGGYKKGYTDDKHFVLIAPSGRPLSTSKMTAAYPPSEGIGIVKGQRGQYRYFDYKNGKFIGSRYRVAKDFTDGIALVQRSDGKVNFLKIDGTCLSKDVWFDEAAPFIKGVSRVRVENELYDLSKDGSLRRPAVFATDVVASERQTNMPDKTSTKAFLCTRFGMTEDDFETMYSLLSRGQRYLVSGKMNTSPARPYSPNPSKKNVYFLAGIDEGGTITVYHPKTEKALGSLKNMLLLNLPLDFNKDNHKKIEPGEQKSYSVRFLQRNQNAFNKL